jgi:membrane protein DedA with SNARE-associated domain
VLLVLLLGAAGLGQLSLPILAAVFITSAVLGDAVNYAIGNKLGESTSYL